MPQAPDVRAAGAVVFRPGREVLVVHRPRYDDWSFPKGKLDPGELSAAAAVREVEEETGLRVRLGPPLPDQHYRVVAGRKVVHYWVGRAVGSDDVDRYPPNDEIDRVAWVDVDRAARLLTYDHDRDTLARALLLRRRSLPLVVLRHGTAMAHREWAGDDRLRPLLPTGRRESAALVPLLAAFDVRRVVSSTALRCRESVAPYAEACGLPVRAEPALSEEEATAAGVRAVLDAVLAWQAERGRGALLCSHRPVLPLVLEALGVRDPGLDKGALLVVHHRRGRVLATEQHP